MVGIISQIWQTKWWPDPYNDVMKTSLTFLLVALSIFGMGQSVTTTSSNGNWTSNGNWSGTSPANDDTAYVNHAMTVNTDIEIDDGHYRINDAGTMIDANGGSNFKLTIKGAGEFDVSGDATFENEAIMQNNCTLWVRSCDTLTVGAMTLKNKSLNESRVGLLKETLEKKGFVRVIEAHNGLSAIVGNDTSLILNDDEKLEFDAIWISSLTDSAAKGHPDAEILGFDSRLETINEVAEVTNKPI